MNVRPLLLPFVILISSFGLLHAAPPPELTVLSQQYEKTLAEKSTAPFDASLATLNTKFTAALDGAIATAQQAGRLDDILAIQDDKKRLAEKLPIPDDDDKTPEALKKLRTIYREQLKKLEEARTTAIATVLPAYTAKLQELEVTLTKAGRIDEAKEVRTYREGLAQSGALSPLSGTSPSAAPTPGNGPLRPTPAAPRLTRAQRAANAKRLATWALANGHALTVKSGGNERRIEPGQNVPDEELNLVSVVRVASVPTVSEPPPWDALSGHAELRELYLANWTQPTAAADLAVLAHLPLLRSLELACTMEGSLVEALPPLPQLNELRLKPSPDPLTAEELPVLIKKTPRLKEVLLDRCVLPDEAFAAIAGWKELQLLVLGGDATLISPVKAQVLAAMTDLNQLMFYGCKPDAFDPQSMAKLKSVTRVQFSYSASLANVQAIVAMPSLAYVGFNDIKNLDDNAFALVAGVAGIQGVWFRNSPAATDAAFTHLLKLEGLVDFECSRNPNVTSVGFQSLATLKKLRKLIVHDTAFDDAALQSLAKSRSLKELGIKKTAVTEAAAKAFQKQRPDVKLER